MTRTLLLATLVLLATGCARSPLARAAREQAVVDLECHPKQIWLEDIGEGTYRATGCNQTVSYTCTLGTDETVCAREQYASQDSRPVRFASGEVPSSAFGIQFGDSLDDFGARCRDREYHFQQFGTDGTCSGMLVDAEFAATVGVGTCGEGICAITMQRPVLGSKELLDALGTMRANLTKRYGAPTQFTSKIPPECEGRVPECLADRRAKIAFQWTWREGFTVDLVPAQTTRGLVVSLAYATPDRAKPSRSSGY
ncbi:MAG TPA: hypothetical protein VHO25_09905 [Polyangiaceae bacterium]|nr:hypothetical protein [Polyangiaceae bacterium]